MSYFHAGETDDFDDCDPARYTGGYDIDLTYGRSLPPSYETCYPIKTSASGNPQFASNSKPSAYAVEARPGNPASVYGGPMPEYGFQPGCGLPEHGGRAEYARPEPGYGSRYGMKPPSSKFGSSHGGSSEYENPSLMHHKPGRIPDYAESGYAPGLRKPASDVGGSRHESGVSGHSGWPEKPTFPMPSYPEPNYPIPSYPEPSYPIPSYPESSYPIPSYPESSYPIPSYPEPSYPMRPSYQEPSYPTPGYVPHKYERDNSDYEERKHHHSHGRGHHYSRH